MSASKGCLERFIIKIINSFFLILLISLIIQVNSSLSVYSGVSIQLGPIAYWSFNNVENNVVPDDSGHNETGYLTNSTIIDGLNGKAIYLNGAYSYMEASYSVLHQASVFGVSLWFKPTQYNHIARLIGIGTNFSESFGIFIDKRPSGYFLFYGVTLLFQQSQRKEFFSQRAATDIQNNVWYNLVFVFSEKNIYLYLNGNLATPIVITHYQSDYNEILPFYSSLILGVEKNNNASLQYPFIGSIDEVRIYNRSLSSVEALSLYLSNRPVTTPQTSNQKTTNVINNPLPGPVIGSKSTNSILFFNHDVLNQIVTITSFSLVGISVSIVVFTMSYYVKLRKRYREENKHLTFSDFIKDIKRESRQRKTVVSLSDKTLKTLEDIIEENK